MLQGCISGSASISASTATHGMRRTVFSIEQSTDKTTCFSGHVAMYVMALTPFTGSIAAVY